MELFGERNPEQFTDNLVAVNTSGEDDQNNDSNAEFECETTQPQVAEVVPTQV